MNAYEVEKNLTTTRYYTIFIVTGGLLFTLGLLAAAVKAFLFPWPPLHERVVDGVTLLESLPDPTQWLWSLFAGVTMVGLVLVLAGIVMRRYHRG